jgi:hypothetical protein
MSVMLTTFLRQSPFVNSLAKLSHFLEKRTFLGFGCVERGEASLSNKKREENPLESGP